jgi:hypothetical protein
MVGTLVLTLPSSFTGGELVVRHNEEQEAYGGSKTALSLVAFYADCRHPPGEPAAGRRRNARTLLGHHPGRAVTAGPG